MQLLTQLKGNMEEENRHLAEQNQSLLKENRALLEQSLERRDQHYSQQREYQSVHTQVQVRSFVFLGTSTGSQVHNVSLHHFLIKATSKRKIYVTLVGGDAVYIHIQYIKALM